MSLSFIDIRLDNEIIYVDNGSGDGSFLKAKDRCPGIKILRNLWNEGVSVARNQGMKAAAGEYFLLLDSDTEITPGALEDMLAFMKEHPEAGLCGCKTFGPTGEIHDSCRPFPTLGGKLTAGWRILANKLHLPVKEPRPYYNKDASEPFEVDYVVGACQMIRRKAQEKIGWMDEHIFYGPEDADFCLRMQQAGYKVYFLPQTVIYHAYQRLSSHKIFSRLNWKHIQGLLYYFKKHARKKTSNKQC
jgi:GT2 family glycosyltransferase